MWWGALIGGASGALAAVIAKLIIRDSHNRRTTYILLVVVFFAVLNAAGQAYILPEVRAWEARRDASRLLAENRIFALLVPRHPEIRDQFTALLVDLTRHGASQEEANLEGIALGRRLVAPYFHQYAPTASSESLVHFVSVMVEILEQLGAREDEACYFWMFGGQAPPGFSISATISQGDQMRMFDAMADVIESAISAPHEPPGAQEAASAIESLIAGLMETHGDDFVASLGMLQQPNAPNIDRRAACIVATEFYRVVLSLPEAEQSVLLPSLFGADAS